MGAAIGAKLEPKLIKPWTTVPLVSHKNEDISFRQSGDDVIHTWSPFARQNLTRHREVKGYSCETDPNQRLSGDESTEILRARGNGSADQRNQ